MVRIAEALRFVRVVRGDPSPAEQEGRNQHEPKEHRRRRSACGAHGCRCGWASPGRQRPRCPTPDHGVGSARQLFADSPGFSIAGGFQSRTAGRGRTSSTGSRFPLVRLQAGPESVRLRSRQPPSGGAAPANRVRRPPERAYRSRPEDFPTAGDGTAGTPAPDRRSRAARPGPARASRPDQ